MILIAGCGFVGSEAVRRLLAEGREVVAVTHTAESAEAVGETFGIRALACNIADPGSVRRELAGLQPETVISCVSSGRGDAAVYRQVYFDGSAHLLGAFPNVRFLFVSSTSVYAQTNGERVDETSPAEPTVETGKVLRETELLTLRAGGIVIRPGGIYGPGRSVLITRFFEGNAVIENDGSRFLNQIHRDDAASAIAFLADPAHGMPGEIYNATDDTPLTQIECYEWLARRAGWPLPPHGEPNPNRKRGLTNKRVSNAKLRALGWTAKFPSFREGAQDCLPGKLT